ncbi:MAG TPA: hypothetical protein PLQ12_09105 [Candidatus Defluviicoccus seviourii]|nr:hypothetical protein [Candidatus Defluviicoccus seviourii]
MSDRQGGALVKLCGMYENTAKASGQAYFTGYLGAARLVMLKARDAKEGEPAWTLFIQERQPKPAGGTEGGR